MGAVCEANKKNSRTLLLRFARLGVYLGTYHDARRDLNRLLKAVKSAMEMRSNREKADSLFLQPFDDVFDTLLKWNSRFPTHLGPQQ
jgi:hypothetical protein